MVAVTNGFDIMELITRATTQLCVILVDTGVFDYEATLDHFYQAAEQGLVEKVTMRSEAAEANQG